MVIHSSSSDQDRAYLVDGDPFQLIGSGSCLPGESGRSDCGRSGIVFARLMVNHSRALDQDHVYLEKVAVPIVAVPGSCLPGRW